MTNPSWLRAFTAFFSRRAPFARRSRRSPARGLRPHLEPLEERALPSTVYWINPFGGDWDYARNWLGGVVPGPGDKAVISLPGTFTVTHSRPVADAVGSLICRQTLDLSAGSLALAGASTINTLKLDGGTLSGPGNVIVTGPITWTVGTLAGGGQVDALGGLTIKTAGAVTLDRTLVNSGTAAWIAGTIDAKAGGTFDNLLGAIFKAQGSGAFHATFNNAGTVLKLGSATTQIDTLTNSGTVGLQTGALTLTNFIQTAGTTFLGSNILTAVNATWTGGTLAGSGGQFDASASLTIDGATPLTSTGITIVNGGVATWIAGNVGTITGSSFDNLAGATFTAQSDATFNTTFDNAGAFQLAGSAVTQIDTFNNSGVVTLQSGTLNTTSYVQTAGATYLGGNALDASNPVQIYGGSLVGGGTINADLVDGGFLTPGGIGVLAVNGNFTQTSSGSLSTAIGGTDPSQVDLLQISGAATFGGSLDVRFVNGFVPGAQGSYTVVTAGAIAEPFAAVNIANPSSKVSLEVVYSPTSVVIAPVPPPPPAGGGGSTSTLGLNSLVHFFPEAVFALPGLLAPHVPDELIQNLAIGRSGAGESRTDTGSGESSARADRGSLAADFRHGAGATSMDESGADDDLVAALLSASSDLDRTADNELLDSFDIATGLLTRLAPKADILPQKGSRLASVATLVSGEAGDATIAQTDNRGDDDLPLRDFLIDPLRKVAPSPAAANPASVGTGSQPSGRASGFNPEARRPAKLPAATVVVWGLLLLGVTVAANRPPNRRRSYVESRPYGQRQASHLNWRAWLRLRTGPTKAKATWPKPAGPLLPPSIYSPLTRNFTVTGK